MKILMLHPHDIFSPNEPWTTRIVNLAKEFRNNGHEVRLAYSPLSNEKAKRDFALDGIEIFTLSRRVGLKSLFDNIGKVKTASQWADIVHFQKCFHYVSVPALVCAFLLNKPLHYEWDDWEEKIWYHSNNKSVHTIIFGNFLRLLERLLPVLADTVSVSSRRLEELCLSFGVERTRIFKAPVGADLKQFGPHILGKSVREKHNLRDKEVVLYLGQLHGGQYVKMFIEAANVVLHKYPNAIFLIVGQGYMADELRSFAVRLGVEDSVVFTGSVAHDLIPQYISASDICVASFEDNEVTACKSPLKIAEYLASGKPVVASLVGELRNMVGGAGLLVEPGDYRALADAIVALAGNPTLRKEMGLKARKRAEHRYNWRNTADNLLKAYATACSLRNRKRKRGQQFSFLEESPPVGG